MSTQPERRGRTLLCGFGFVILLLVGGVAVPSTPAHAGECASLQPGWVFCEDFEDGTWLDTWSSGNNEQGVICSPHAYSSSCTAWTGTSWGYDGLGYDGHYADTGFTSSGYNELYFRWYTKISNPFTFGDTGDKNVIVNDVARTIGPYIMISMWGTGQPYSINYGNSGTPCVNQSTPNVNGEFPDCVNRWQNQGNDITLIPGHTYLFEWYMKWNTPGQANGVQKLWINDVTFGPPATQTLRMQYTDIVTRGSGDSGKNIGRIWLSGYHNTGPAPAAGQFQTWDQIVVSRSPIGPMGSTPPCPLRGDLDCSGKVDFDDLRLMIYMLVGTVPKDLAKADLDGDGDVDLDDLRRMIFIFVGLP